MARRILFMLACRAFMFGANEPDPRAGLWQGTTTSDGQQRVLWFLLRMSLQLQERPYPHNGLWIPPIYGFDEQGRYCGVADVQLTAGHIGIRCVRYTGAALPVGPPDYTFEGTFDAQTGITGTWLLGDKKIPIHYARPAITGTDQLQGDWVASGGGRTCVLHLYDDPPMMLDYGPTWYKGTIDRLADENSGWAILGEPVRASAKPDGSVNVFDAAAVGPPFANLVGKLDTEKNAFSAQWAGGVRLGCSDGSAAVVFKRASRNRFN